MPVTRNLPPLTTIRAFEAAARHRSFTLAAEELSVTQSAVSLQIRKLETFLEKRLFVRGARHVELSEAGMLYFDTCRRILGELETATHRVRDRTRREVLTVNTIPTIGQLWLMPRLAAFTAAHRDIEIRVVSDIRPLDMLADGVDLAIRVGPLAGKRYPRDAPAVDLTLVKDWDGICADFLFDDILTPVMSRTLHDQGGPIASLDDLTSFELIHTASRPDAWRDWLRVQGAALPVKRAKLEYGHFYIAMRAAHEHQGIALIPDILLDGYPGRNELVVPYRPATTVKSAGAYYLLTHQGSQDRPAIATFRTWVLEEAQRSGGAAPALS